MSKSAAALLGVHTRILELSSFFTSCMILSTTVEVFPVPGLKQDRQEWS